MSRSKLLFIVSKLNAHIMEMVTMELMGKFTFWIQLSVSQSHKGGNLKEQNIKSVPVPLD